LEYDSILFAFADISTCRHYQHSPTASALADNIGTLRHQHLPTLSAEPQFVASTQHYFSYNTDKQVVRTAKEVLMSPTAVNSRCFTVPNSNPATPNVHLTASSILAFTFQYDIFRFQRHMIDLQVP
jgi:hypothetical protein